MHLSSWFVYGRKGRSVHFTVLTQKLSKKIFSFLSLQLRSSQPSSLLSPSTSIAVAADIASPLLSLHKRHLCYTSQGLIFCLSSASGPWSLFLLFSLYYLHCAICVTKVFFFTFMAVWFPHSTLLLTGYMQIRASMII